MSIEENLSQNERDRRNCIIKYVKKYPECQKEDVIIHCSSIGEGSRVTLSKSIKELIDEGFLNEGKEKKNSKSFKLTVVDGNLLLTIPQDLQDIFSSLITFTKIVRNKMNEEVESMNITSAVDMNSYVNKSEGRKSLPLLPYYVTEIINNLYTFYFNFILPKKIERINMIRRLYSLYFESLSNVYPSILTELGDNVSHNPDTYAQTKMDIYEGHLQSDHPGLYPIYRTVRLCKINGIDEQLYEVLDQLWLKNMESSVLLYALSNNNESSKKESKRDRENMAMDETSFKDNTTYNEILTQIHIKIDSYIYQQEKEEKEGLL